MNTLGKTIEKGELVVVAKDVFPKALPARERVFICDGTGFGCSTGTIGTAVFGRWLDGDGKDRIEGTHIDAGETSLFHLKFNLNRKELLVGAVEALAEIDELGLELDITSLREVIGRIFAGV